jgi:hypothetical protein
MKKLIIISLSMLFMVFLPIHQVNALPTTINVNVVSYFDATNKPQVAVNDLTYGSKVAFNSSLTADSGYEFAFWVINGVVREDLPIDYQFVISGQLEIQGVFKPVGQYYVAFIDSNGQLLKVDYVDQTGFDDAVAPATATLSKPGFIIDSLEPWIGLDMLPVTLDNITEDIIAIVNYETNVATTYNISVTGGIGGGSEVAFNSVVTVTADTPEVGAYFNYWKTDLGKILSYDPVYKFTALSDLNIEAVFSTVDVTEVPLVTISKRLNIRTDMATYVGQYYIPDGYSIVEYGILSNNTANFNVDTVGVYTYRSTKSNPVTKEFVMSFALTIGLYTKAYLVVKDSSNNLQVVYSTENAPYATTLEVNGFEIPAGKRIFFNKNPMGVSSTTSNNDIWIYTDFSKVSLSVGSAAASGASAMMIVGADGTTRLARMWYRVDGTEYMEEISVFRNKPSFTGPIALNGFYSAKTIIGDLKGNIILNGGTASSWIIEEGEMLIVFGGSGAVSTTMSWWFRTIANPSIGSPVEVVETFPV